MRQPLEAAQRFQNRRIVDANGAAQRHRRQCIGCIVQPGQLHITNRQHRLLAACQPQLVMLAQQTIITVAGCSVEAKPHGLPRRLSHATTPFVFAIQHHQPIAMENTRLGISVIRHAVITIHVIFSHVQNHSGVGVQRLGGFQLKARQLQYKHVRLTTAEIAQRIQHTQADIAGNHGFQTCIHADLPDQRGHGGFAVGAGDGNDFRIPATDGLRKQFNVAHHRQSTGHGIHDRRRCQRHTGADHRQVAVGKGVFVKRAGKDFGVSQLVAQLVQMRWLLAAIGDTHLGATRMQPARGREAGFTHSENDDFLAGVIHCLTAVSMSTNQSAPTRW